MRPHVTIHPWLDKWIEIALMLALPMLLFLLTAIGAYSSSKHVEFAVVAGLFGFLVGAVISMVIKLLVRIDIYTLPIYVFLICYFIFMLFFYLTCQAIPFLLPFVGMFASISWKRRCLHNDNRKFRLSFERFRVSFFTAFFTGLFTLFSFLALLSGIPPIGWLEALVPIMAPLHLPVFILVMLTCSALMAYLQFNLSKWVF